MTKSTAPLESFQISLDTAELYESVFVPALFAQWAPLLCDLAGVGPGQSVLDVACGTGAVARAAAERVAPGGRVVGLDLNDAMLTVARRLCPDLEWRKGDASALPFPDDVFDIVLCQMALMFFADPAMALGEMSRVAGADGTVAVVVPARLDVQDAFAPFVEMAACHAGPDARSLLTTYFAWGDLEDLSALFESAGLQITATRTPVGLYRASSVEAWVTTEVESTPLVERISAEVYQRIRADAPQVLDRFTLPDGSVEAPFTCHLVAARRRSQ